MTAPTLRERARAFLELSPPADLPDHSLGRGIIAAYATDDEKLRDPNMPKALKAFLMVLTVAGQPASPECRAYVAEEVELLRGIQRELTAAS